MKRWLLLLLLCLAASQAWAVNKCVGPDGKIIFQDTACDVGSKSSEKVKVWSQQPSGGGVRIAQPTAKLEGPEHAKPLLDLYRRWIDAEKLASSTGRIAMSGPVASMQAIQREAEAMSPPDCLAAPHKILTELTKRSTEAMLAFMSKDGLGSFTYQFLDRQRLVPAFERAVTGAKCD